MHWIHVQVFFDARIFQLHKLEHEKSISNNYIMKFLSLEPDSLHMYVFTLVLGPLSWDVQFMYLYIMHVYQWDTRNVFERDFTSNGKQWTN